MEVEIRLSPNCDQAILEFARNEINSLKVLPWHLTRAHCDIEDRNETFTVKLQVGDRRSFVASVKAKEDSVEEAIVEAVEKAERILRKDKELHYQHIKGLSVTEKLATVEALRNHVDFDIPPPDEVPVDADDLLKFLHAKQNSGSEMRA